MARCAAVAIALTLGLAGPADAITLGDLTNQEAVTGLKDALIQGADHAVAQLGTANGYMINLIALARHVNLRQTIS